MSVSESTDESTRDEAIQHALVDAVERYASRVQERGELQPFPSGHEPSATHVAVTVAAMMKAVEVYSFEIAAMFNV